MYYLIPEVHTEREFRSSMVLGPNGEPYLIERQSNRQPMGFILKPTVKKEENDKSPIRPSE